MHVDLTTTASPDQVLQALTDFTDRRPRTWHRTLDAKTYELRELGDTWAVARESTAGSPFWVVERYDWSDPSVVRWVDVETSWGGLGSGEVRIVPLDGGGSRVEARWTSGDARRLRDKLLLRLLHRGPMSRVIARMWRRTLDEVAQA
ncbi:MAG TPA: SRPBCC family protein [Nocardioides sp.]|nr:SRPBCC family protein [Nocardioides sp.]